MNFFGGKSNNAKQINKTTRSRCVHFNLSDRLGYNCCQMASCSSATQTRITSSVIKELLDRTKGKKKKILENCFYLVVFQIFC